MASPRSVISRLKALPHYRLDALLGLVIWLEICLEMVVFTPLTGVKLVAALGLAGLFGLGIALRRRMPVLAIALASSGFLIGDLFGPEITENVLSPFFVLIFIAFSVGARTEGVSLAAAFLIGAALVGAAVSIDDYPNEPASFVFSITFAVGAPMLFGQLMRNRSRLNHTLREKAARADAVRAGEAEAAATEERTRIAGELHDVVAHALSAMTVQATAARRRADGDPEDAKAAFAAVEATGREALTELRRLLGVLRKEDEELALAPQPSLANVDGLARRATASGLPVELAVLGTARRLPAGVDLTAYRVVQEALGSARDSGGAGRARVTVAYGPESVAVEIRDDGGAAERRAARHTRARRGLRRRAGDRRRRRRLARERVAACGGDRVTSRFRDVPARVWDVLLTLTLLAILLADLMSGTFDHNAAGAVAVSSLIALLPLIRRQLPLATVYVWAGLLIVMAVAVFPPANVIAPFIGLFVFPYNVGLRVPGRRALLGIPAIWAAMTAVALSADTFVWGDIFFPASFGTVFWLVGRATASRSRLTAELHEAAVRADEEREAQASRAVADERRRIAREMHDVVAHSVSMMVVQAGGARRILDRDPARAVAAAELIERTGREALAEMRRLLGVLHPGEHAEYTPQPTLLELDALVERTRVAGVPVTLTVEGERRELPVGLDLAAYRVVQEALTNVLKHGGGAPTDVVVHYRADAVEVRIADRGNGTLHTRLDGSGQGLVGMRERVRMYGGELQAGRRRGGGFEVSARLPLEGEEDAALTAGMRA
jgi:signal transduction histidine kinase